jgi:VWFA-related protein
MLRHTMLACIAAAVAAAPIQQAQFRSATDIVEVYATVTRRGGALVRDLKREDFEVFEDGQRREIVAFSAERRPLSVAILLDRSGSTAPSARDLLAAGRAFAGQLAESDRASFGTLMWDCLPFTGDFSAITTVLTRLPRDYGSPIWSAVDRIMTSFSGETGRRVILLLSDGLDVFSPVGPREMQFARLWSEDCSFMSPASGVSLRDVIRRAEQDSVMVYAVTPEARTIEAGIGASNMSRLAGGTGGGFHLLSDISHLRAAFTSIADELRMQYLLGFVPTYFDGRRHEIKVKVKSGGSVRAREAYVAAKR